MDVATHRSARGFSGREVRRRHAAGAPGPRNPSAHGCHNARDLHCDVTAARRREDLSEPWCQAPVPFQPDVTLLCCLLSSFALLGLASGGGRKAEALALLGKFGRPALRSGQTGPPPPSSSRTRRPCPQHSPPSGGRNVEKSGVAVLGADEP